jgi:peptidoglycan-associated lipoprotein
MKKLALATGLGALLLLVGCSSKQPNLENAAQQNATEATTTTQNQPTTATANNQNESVNTENATVEEETITPTTITVSKTQNNQQFAKKLASIVVYFDFDKYNIRPDQWPKVEKLANLIKSNPSNYTVRIEGNCDEWGTEEYNYALGLRRANSVKNALIKLGVDPKKLTIISYGELNPVCTAHAKWCWRLNRRDNFTYLP